MNSNCHRLFFIVPSFPLLLEMRCSPFPNFPLLCDKPDLKNHIGGRCIRKFKLPLWYTFPKSSTGGVWILNEVTYSRLVCTHLNGNENLNFVNLWKSYLVSVTTMDISMERVLYISILFSGSYLKEFIFRIWKTTEPWLKENKNHP